MRPMLQTPSAIRVVYETLRYSMLARGLRFQQVVLPPGAVVPSLSYLDGRPLYRRVQKTARKIEEAEPLVNSGGPTSEPPLAVFLHGLGSSIATWSTVLPTIARRAPVVAPDLPGFGRTPPPADSPYASLREHVDAAHTFIDAVSPDAPVQLVGQSLGGWIAARIASERPERVARLTLVNATGILHPQLLEQRRLFSPHNDEELIDLWQRMWYRLPTSFWLLRRQYLELTRTPIVRGFMDSFDDEDFLDPKTLDRIDAPTLLVWGIADRLVDYQFARAYREGVKDIRFRPIPACGHVPQRESPAMFLHYVLPWVLGEEPPEPARPGLDAAQQEVPSGESEKSGRRIRISRRRQRTHSGGS